MPQTKIATCNYCGNRAALVLNGRDSHELACASCGAPLHDLKKIKSGQVDADAHRAPRKGKKAKRTTSLPGQLTDWETVLRKPKKRKLKKKSTSRKVLSEAFDLLGDIFD